MAFIRAGPLDRCVGPGPSVQFRAARPDPAAPVPSAAPAAPAPKPAKAPKPKAKKKHAPAEGKTTPVKKNVVLNPPVTAIVKCDVLDVRGQGSFTGEVITHVKKGESVTVLEETTLDHVHPNEPAQWSRIVLPTNTPVWVDADFIEPESKAVRVKKVNVRGGPGRELQRCGPAGQRDRCQSNPQTPRLVGDRNAGQRLCFCRLGVFGQAGSCANGPRAGRNAAARHSSANACRTRAEQFVDFRLAQYLHHSTADADQHPRLRRRFHLRLRLSW